MTESQPAATADRILDVAEEMFAEQGYRAVSVRSITRACDANIAAVHYHFGSKQILLEEIFARRSGAINAARLKLLDDCAEQPGRAPVLEQVLEAYLRPSFAQPSDDEGARRFMRLRSVVAHEQAELSKNLIAKHFNATSQRFIAAIAAATPHLSANDVFWRFHFLLGAHYYTLSNPGRIQALSGDQCDPADLEAALAEMVTFAAAGFRAPPCDRSQLSFTPITSQSA
ncbi:TetR/AcrR family transcriptional regulator [Bosea sp. BK604]|uniref:TetR/AcrR family transcriptional regulator n=1 Tax=Bosea sp. BK604 TaxID=2512180 RepID=UPI0010DF58FE|nr:TetR/AcrR family transcriptional regulator [Bosea sp. BK604]TCR65556.1 TetR family transcriptional regulator [Bosea sp. BK604]